MRVRLLAAALVLGFAVVPASGSAARSDLQTMASALANELANAELDGATQDEVRVLLERSLALVRGSKAHGGGDACADFAVPIYSKQWQPATALEKAMALCSRRTDTDLLRLAYPIFSKVHQPVSALEEAAAIAQRGDLWGKTALVEYAKVRLSKVYQETDALKKACELAAPVARDGAACVQRAYETYAKLLDVQPALTKSFDACSDER